MLLDKSSDMDKKLYEKEIEAIFNRFPSFQNVGGAAYKPGLESVSALCAKLGNPHLDFKSIHIAGTNGKGSTSHMIASALASQRKSSGEYLKVGLYTSPHLVDFRERMKVSNPLSGKTTFTLPPEEYVYDFLVDNKGLFEECGASFFEITTIMAFSWFSHCKVDIAVIECGLGGRLDATNIVSPILSVITNIGLDHCDYLGDTLHSIAGEKAGIIKPGIPVVIGEESGVGEVFARRANELSAPLVKAEEYQPRYFKDSGEGKNYAIDASMLDLKGFCQEKNLRCVVAAIEQIIDIAGCDNVDFPELVKGICNAASISWLRGRWEVLEKSPFVVCDTGHNAHGFSILGGQIKDNFAMKQIGDGDSVEPYGRLFMLFGVVADKDLDSIVEYLPDVVSNSDGEVCRARYLFVNAQGRRALPAQLLKERMERAGFDGEIVGDGSISGTLDHYFKVMARPSDFLFIGGSTFVVAEALQYYIEER